MKRLPAVLLLGLAAACRAGPSANADALELRALRDAFFKAVAAYDSASIRAATTPDYVLIEDGAVWNVDSLISVMMGLQKDGLRIAYAFDEDSIRVEGSLAWMTYRNRGVLSGESGADTLNWVESALFRRHAGTWKMVLLHSTRVRRGR